MSACGPMSAVSQMCYLDAQLLPTCCVLVTPAAWMTPARWEHFHPVLHCTTSLNHWPDGGGRAVCLDTSLTLSFFGGFFHFSRSLTGGLWWPAGLRKQWQDDSDGCDQLGWWLREKRQAWSVHPCHPLHRLDQWQNQGEPGCLRSGVRLQGRRCWTIIPTDRVCIATHTDKLTDEQQTSEIQDTLNLLRTCLPVDQTDGSSKWGQQEYFYRDAQERPQSRGFIPNLTPCSQLSFLSFTVLIKYRWDSKSGQKHHQNITLHRSPPSEPFLVSFIAFTLSRIHIFNGVLHTVVIWHPAGGAGCKWGKTLQERWELPVLSCLNSVDFMLVYGLKSQGGTFNPKQHTHTRYSAEAFTLHNSSHRKGRLKKSLCKDCAIICFNAKCFWQ